MRKLVGWPQVWMALPLLSAAYTTGLLVTFELTKHWTNAAVDAELLILPFIGFVAACQTVWRWRAEHSAA